RRGGTALEILLFDDTSGLATTATQIIKLRPANTAATKHLIAVNERAKKRAHKFHAFTVRNLTAGEIRIDAAARARDANDCIGLYARTFAYDNLHVHVHRIARTKFGNFLACCKSRNLVLLKLLDDIHVLIPRISRRPAAILDPSQITLARKRASL